MVSLETLVEIYFYETYQIKVFISQWNLLLKDYCEAKGYIEDIREICDDFEWLCQRNLAANTGEKNRTE